MIIFNVEIYGDDALYFCSMSKSEQSEWIKKYTNQQSDLVIDEFLSNPLKIGGMECKKCGEMNNKIIRHDSNISKGNAEESSVDSLNVLDKTEGQRDSGKRPKGFKRKKD